MTSKAKSPRTPLKHQWSIGHNYLTGITFGKWLRLLAENRFHVSPAYWHRAAFITLASLSNSAMAGVEQLRFGLQIRKVPLDKPPLFILGHWRSGTTLLHDLLAHDRRQFNFANTYQVVNPYTFLTTEGAMTRLFPWLVPPKRPMDNMALAFSSPQEDEFAPLLMSLKSVYLGISFPKNTAAYEQYLTFKDAPRADLVAWQDAMRLFCQKLSLRDGRSLLMKSPPHTGRIAAILEMFPDARFVHIHRDPYRVFQSQRHFFDTAGWYTYLQRPDPEAIDRGILQRYRNMYDAYFEDLALIPEGRICDLRFDALEADPFGQIEKVYDQLGLEGFETFAPNLRAYVGSLRGYEKNRFTELDPADKALVAQKWGRSFDTWGYAR